LKVLIVEDNETLREGMAQVLRKMGLEVAQAADGAAALRHLALEPTALVVTDYRMAGMDGIAVLQQVKKSAPATEVLIITAYGSIDLAVQAMQLGAADFIAKPFSHEEFKLRIGRILQKIEQDEKLSRLSDENSFLRQELEEACNFGQLIGDSPQMQELYRAITKVARTDSTVILYGESGTGKELAAHAIHKSSERAQHPFIRVHCGALAEGVLESELFGHEKGAFTGAVRRKRGRFELAHSGTLFLDEIGDITPGTQVKLLRVLQERQFERVGGEQTLTVDVRVIAATHRNLLELVEEGTFRRDLYYRLHIIPIQLPPLRERGEDIILLARHFLQRICSNMGRPLLPLTPDAEETLRHYTWPGNVRELENILERAVVLAEGEALDVRDLPVAAVQSTPAAPSAGAETLDEMLDRLEKAAIERAMTEARGVKMEAARRLGIKASALYYKLEKYGLVEGEEPVKEPSADRGEV
jgi:two-component system response regulator HydG